MDGQDSPFIDRFWPLLDPSRFAILVWGGPTGEGWWDQ